MSGSPISTGGSGLPPRIILHGVEGIGKTSLGAFMERPVFVMTANETGLLTLIDNQQVPPTPHFEECRGWNDLVEAVQYLIKTPGEERTLVIDTLNGAQQMCFAHICETQFNGRTKDFNAYGRGAAVAQSDWHKFLLLLDQLRARRHLLILCLCHTRVKPYHNPLGDDYDRFAVDMDEKAWGLAAKWSDAILFANFQTTASKEDKYGKAKGAGGTARVLHTQRSAAWDAKNRIGLPGTIPLSGGAREAAVRLREALRLGRSEHSGHSPEGPTVPGGAARTDPAATPPRPAPHAGGNGHGKLTPDEAAALADLKKQLCQGRGLIERAEIDALWTSILGRWGVRSASDMNPEQRKQLVSYLVTQIQADQMREELMRPAISVPLSEQEEAANAASGGR